MGHKMFVANVGPPIATQTFCSSENDIGGCHCFNREYTFLFKFTRALSLISGP
jgi:hypothetical protein